MPPHQLLRSRYSSTVILVQGRGNGKTLWARRLPLLLGHH